MRGSLSGQEACFSYFIWQAIMLQNKKVPCVGECKMQGLKWGWVARVGDPAPFDLPGL